MLQEFVFQQEGSQPGRFDTPCQKSCVRGHLVDSLVPLLPRGERDEADSPEEPAGSHEVGLPGTQPSLAGALAFRVVEVVRDGARASTTFHRMASSRPTSSFSGRSSAGMASQTLPIALTLR